MRPEELTPRDLVLEPASRGGLSLGARRQGKTRAVGAAPVHHESGTLRGRRTIWVGRAHVCATLDRHIRVAIRNNPGRKACDARLRTAGTVAQVVLTACRRRLVRRLNALVQHHTLWHAQEVSIVSPPRRPLPPKTGAPLVP